MLHIEIEYVTCFIESCYIFILITIDDIVYLVFCILPTLGHLPIKRPVLSGSTRQDQSLPKFGTKSLVSKKTDR